MAKRKKYRFTTARNTSYQIKASAWKKYTATLRMLSETASKRLTAYITEGHTEQEILDYAYALVTKYGEGAAELACEMYDALAAYSDALVPPAVPAATATYGETAGAIRGEMKRTDRVDVISSAAGRLVKMASADTMQQNALRDGAEWAWIPQGDTCAFCLTLASRGWQRASQDAIRNGHAEHIHNNCDCNYCVRLDPYVTVEGYDPEWYLAMYNNAPGGSPEKKINAMRREFYAENKEVINEQKRSAYAKRMERNSSAAEEINVD